MANLHKDINEASNRLQNAREAYRESDKTDRPIEQAEEMLRPFGLTDPELEVERELADAKVELKRLRSLL